MNKDELRAQLEEELSWRLEEINFLQNSRENLEGKDNHEKFNKALILFLYSHFEGFFKFAWELYIKYLNELEISCSTTSSVISRLALDNVFKELRSSNKKSKIFKKELPDDGFLHAFSREIEFLESLEDIWSIPLKIDLNVIDVESNLKPVVVKKNMYKLGFKHDVFSHNDGYINNLLNMRNKIAHGARKSGVETKEYDKLKTIVVNMMEEIVKIIYASVSGEGWRKKVELDYLY